MNGFSDMWNAEGFSVNYSKGANAFTENKLYVTGAVVVNEHATVLENDTGSVFVLVDPPDMGKQLGECRINASKCSRPYICDMD